MKITQELLDNLLDKEVYYQFEIGDKEVYKGVINFIGSSKVLIERDDFEVHDLLELKDYGKNWWLTKEEMPMQLIQVEEYFYLNQSKCKYRIEEDETYYYIIENSNGKVHNKIRKRNNDLLKIVQFYYDNEEL